MHDELRVKGMWSFNEGWTSKLTLRVHFFAGSQCLNFLLPRPFRGLFDPIGLEFVGHLGSFWLGIRVVFGCFRCFLRTLVELGERGVGL